MPVIEKHEPVAEQVRQVLRNSILNHEYAPNERLPSEDKLSEQLGVSRATVRTALAALAAEGLVTRRQGDGTYVNKRIIEVKMRFEGIWEFSRLIESSGHTVSIRVIEEQRRPATRQEAASLRLYSGENVLALQRLFLADDKPVILSKNVLPEKYVTADYPAEALTHSILKFLNQYCGRQYGYAIADISAAQVTPQLGALLDLDNGIPIVRMDEVFFTTEDIPLVVVTNFYNDKALRLRVLRQ